MKIHFALIQVDRGPHSHLLYYLFSWDKQAKYINRMASLKGFTRDKSGKKKSGKGSLLYTSWSTILSYFWSIGLKQASLHSPQHTEVLPHPCFSGNLIGGEREERGTRREGRKAESAKETGSGTGHLNVSNCPGVWTLVGHAILPPASSQRVPD